MAEALRDLQDIEASIRSYQEAAPDPGVSERHQSPQYYKGSSTPRGADTVKHSLS